MDEDPINEGGGEHVTTNLVALGDVIFIKLHGGSWWPAQVVDENAVSKSLKPGKRSAGKVLVRLYGSYKYLYVDPFKCHSQFEKILKKHNGSYKEIFEQALEQELPGSKPSKSKHSGSKTKSKHSGSKTKSKQSGSKTKSKHSGSKTKAKGNSKRHKPSSSTQNTGNLDSPDQIEVLDDNDLTSQNPEELATLGTSQELSERRMRVMNKLGLTAPPGSPFHKT